MESFVYLCEIIEKQLEVSRQKTSFKDAELSPGSAPELPGGAELAPPQPFAGFEASTPACNHFGSSFRILLPPSRTCSQPVSSSRDEVLGFEQAKNFLVTSVPQVGRLGMVGQVSPRRLDV